MLPKLTDANREFWTGGRTGRLLVPRCTGCGRWVLPPPPQCPGCGGAVTYEPVSGRGAVYTFTVNHYQFHPDVAPPNIIAIVQLDEQDDLRVATNLVHCVEEDVTVGLPVTVLFEEHGEVYYPVFEPAGDST
jgi:uncharacterized protein